MPIAGIDDEVAAGAVVVVIDVIRAFTTAAVAFERGATTIACASPAAAARDLRRRHPERMLIGEVRGLKPDDFDFGNSPLDLLTVPLDGRALIQATSNGTRGLVRHPQAAAVLAAAAVNVGATARWIRAHHPGAPWTLVCTGRTAEDRACAEHLRALLDGGAPRPDDLVAGVMAGAAEHLRTAAGLPPAQRSDLARDLPLCCDVDRAGFAMVGEIRADHVALTPVVC